MKIKLLAILVLLLIYVPVSAYDFIENGIAYNILKDGTLSVTHKQKEGWTLTTDNTSLTYRGDIIIPAQVVHSGKKYKVTEIGSYSFYDCQSLKSVTIPEGIRKIDFEAFLQNFGALNSIHIPASVVNLVPGFINMCPNIVNVTVAPNNKNYTSEGNCIYNKKKTHLIFVSSKLRNYIFPPTVNTIVDYAFTQSTIKKLVIPSTVKYIGGRAIQFGTIGQIVCKGKLKKLPGSEDCDPTSELPFWVERGGYVL